MDLVLVLNSDAGTLRGLDPAQAAEELAGIFRARGHTIRVEVRAGSEAIQVIREVCSTRSSQGIIVGGGDGTVSAAAAAAAESGLTLGVLPLGTMNLFARALGIPLEMRAAAESLSGGDDVAIDISEVNGRYFIHHLTLGLHPRMIRIRERMSYGSRIGKIIANFQALWIALRRPPRLRLRMMIDGTAVERRTAALFVSNTPFGEGHIPYSDDLRQGKLGIYASTSGRWGDLVKLAAGLTLGDVAGNRQLESWQATRLEIDPGKPVINGSVDGEIVSLQSPLKVQILARHLRVIKPAATVEQATLTGIQGTQRDAR